MNELWITEAVKQFGITSKTLRYYERVGLLEAKRSENNNYRYYNEAEVERIKQIIILRKMQISIKDIIRIYENGDMSTVVEVFVNRINAIDSEIGTLCKLKQITDEFLQIMLKSGVTKISTLPILYEQMEKQLNKLEKYKNINYIELSTLSDKMAKPVVLSILPLSSMRVLSSVRKDGKIDPDGFWRWVQKKGISKGEPGRHERFEFQADGIVLILRVSDDFVNDGDYSDYIFDGGLFAVVNVYLDEDLNERFRSLVKEFDDNKYYQIDYKSDGSLRHAAMLEDLISPDEQRELVALLVPVKKRLADPSLFDNPEEAAEITVSEIEAANPILWEINVPLDKLTQTHPQNSYFQINKDGEVEYIAWILRAVLNTNVSVKLPFRIDMEFRQSGECKTGIVFYHSEDTGYPTGRIGNRSFGVNMSNDNEQMIQAIRFHQPIFWDDFHFPKRGAIKKDEPNRLTWIVGEKHFAVIINGEVRYCGVNFPYMSLDLSREEACPIVIGTHGNEKIFFRSIRISQLVETQKNKIKEGELIMITKQSNNIIPVIHRLVTDEYGENYWFNGCAKYVMECMGEKDYDYWFFAGLTGDIFTQHYTYTKYSGDALSSYRMDENPKQFVKDTFSKCGYAATYVSKQELEENTEMYLNTLMAYIDKGIPVIAWGMSLVGVFVGYEEYGKTLLYITGNNNQPERITLDEATKKNGGWIFVGERKENFPLAQIYRDAIGRIPQHFKVKTDTYCFGAEAFKAWANDIENGKFDGMKTEDFDTWGYYTNYVCVLATNGSCCYGFFDKAKELNPDFTWLDKIKELYRQTGKMWNNDNGKDLEALGGGFNVILEILQDKEKRTKIAAVIRKCGDCIDEILQVLQNNL